MRVARFVPIDGATGAVPTPSGARWHTLLDAAYQDLPGGDAVFWGVPFVLAPKEDEARWVWLGPGGRRSISLPVNEPRVSRVVFAHFTAPAVGPPDASLQEGRPTGIPKVGEHVADYALEYVDGGRHHCPIRRRFEINDALVTWGQLAFAARPHRQLRPLDWRGPHAVGEWGYNQTAAELPDYEGLVGDPSRRPIGTYWLYALPNPEPERSLRSVRLTSRGNSLVAVAGITLFEGPGDPLRHEPLATARFQVASRETEAVPVSVDLGVIARRYPAHRFDPEQWLAATPGLGDPPSSTDPATFFVDFAASEAATLSVAGEDHSVFELLRPRRLRGNGGATRVELVDRPQARVLVEVVDAATGAPTASRIRFATLDGRYLPPDGHRREVNDSWFEDYGADLKLGPTEYAYVGGRFEIALPVGEVLVEISKGFEHRPIRQRVGVDPDRPMLRFELERDVDFRRAGWVSADTHVHFVSTESAWLMGQAEGINVVNLLAAQWGDLFTNIADFTGEPSAVSRGDTLVSVGTENRQHVLGHISLLGSSSMVTPLSAGGPNESYIGDPLWTGLSGWADAARARGGLAIIPHFPNPDGETAAAIVTGRIDGVEIRDFWSGVNSASVGAWYRYLNAGFRVAAVGGTDKMSAGMPIGGVRTYGLLGEDELTFETWAETVRRGRTVTTSGPLLELVVDGHPIGAELPLPRGGGRVEVHSQAFCLQGLRRLEIVQNGEVVAETASPVDSNRLTVDATLDIRAPGWIAARCEGSALALHCWPVRLAAHTSPIYLRVGDHDRPTPRRADRTYLSTLIEGGLAWVDRLATPGSPERQRQIRSAFTEALDILASKPMRTRIGTSSVSRASHRTRSDRRE